MYSIVRTDHRQILIWNKDVDVHDEAMDQGRNLASLPFVYKHVVMMPDAHADIGVPVGAVVATTKAIVPAAVGADIGCGMMACHTNVKASALPDDLSQIRQDIERAVPHGSGKKKGVSEWIKPPPEAIEIWISKLAQKYHRIAQKNPAIDGDKAPTYQHLGTLGGGNHFVELCLDEKDNLWITLHTGSRSVGNRISDYFMDQAREFAERNFIDHYLPDPNLAYFTSGNESFGDYTEAMLFAQEYAKQNRVHIMDNIFKALRRHFPDIKQTKVSINCHHNYAEVEKHNGKSVWVSRKGAVNAKRNAYRIIAGSMGTGSYIVKGEGNPFSFSSCSHGAGRAMSITEARNSISQAQHHKDCKKVEHSASDATEHSPRAYKDLDAVIDSQRDLVTVKTRLRPIVNVRG